MSFRVLHATAVMLVTVCSLSVASAGIEITPADGFEIEWDGNDGEHFDPVPPEDGGSVVPDNLALASNGATAFDSGQLGPELGLIYHLTENINDGEYGNSRSWIGGSDDPDPWFAGVAFGSEVTIGSVAWGRDNGNGEWDESDPGTDACGGQCDDRSTGLYELQITTDPNPGPDSTWTSVGEFDYFGSDDFEPGGDFTEYLRHEYSISRSDGSPVQATGVRLLVPSSGLGGGTAIDELEVYGAPKPMTLAEEGGGLAENNLARAGTPFAKDLIADGGFAAHQIAHINDEIYGNSNSWIGNSEGTFVGIAFPSAVEFQSLAFGRDNGGEEQEFTDRSVGIYEVQFTEALNPDENTPDEEWDTLDTLDYTQAGGLLTKPHLRHRYNFDQIEATGIRIITFNGACIDEIEIYDQPGEVQMPLPTLRPVLEGGEFAPDNLAEGATPFTNGDLGPDLGIDFHVAANLNDLTYGNSNSWIGNSPTPFGGINLGATPVTVRSFAFGRDNNGGFADRNLGTYTVQTTTVANPDANTADESWETVGLVIYSEGSPANPALRHGFNLSEPVEITGLRLLTPAGAAIDELEIYAGTLAPTPPPGIETTPADGFQLTWDGNDGDFFDPVPPPDGAVAPDNLALAVNGGEAFGSSERNPGGIHAIVNVNDGFYGNANSWIADEINGDPDPFIGINLGAAVEISRIAWGRDNGNGEVDDSDSGTDACGGQCDDRSTGEYELQVTTVDDPDEATDSGDWTTVGTINIARNNDFEIGGDATVYLRHEFSIATGDGDPVTATGVRILVPTVGIAIDEIEVYGAGDLRILRPVQEGGEFDEDNLATAGTAFAFDLLGDGSFAPTHTIENVNNGSYGNGSSWIGNSENSFVGINLGADPVTLASMAFGRDNTGSFTDRSVGTYTLQYTTMPNPDESTPDDQWLPVGQIVYEAGNPENPSLRHRVNFAEIMATGIRLFAPGEGLASGAAVDEIELYSDPLIVIPPPPEALEITPGEGFEVTWDGNDGDHFDPVPPDDDGSKVPDNLAHADGGAEAFASDEFGDIHLIENINDGFYGNANSWIDGGADPAFSGVRFGRSVEINRVAWGRDNGNGQWDDSDAGTDRCGGQCDDRDSGLYTLQFTTVSNPDETTDDADWTTIGEFNYKFSNDDEPGGEFTSHLRHEYVVATAGGGSISATGIRILQPNGNAIDEIEVYGAARDPFLAFDDGNEVSFTFTNLDVQFVGFDFENRGSGQELVISSVTFEGANAANFSLFSEQEPIPAGGAGGIVANFDPMGAGGTFTADMVVMSNDSQEPEQRVSITVNVNVEVDPDKDTDGDGVPDVKEIGSRHGSQ